MADAEDSVQETYLRWHATDRERVSEPRAFLMTTTTRICLDMLTSARAQREEYVGPWLPEPVVDAAALAPDSHAELAEDLSIALLLILDQLSPPAARRVRFLVQRSGPGTGAERGRMPAACRPRPRARARSATTRRDRTVGFGRAMRSMRSSCPHSWRQPSRAISMH